MLVILNSLGIGGAENYTISLLNQFIKQRNKIILYVLSNDLKLADRYYKYKDIKICRRMRKVDFNIIKMIRAEIKNGNYDVIISSYPLYITISTIFLKFKTLVLYPLHSTEILKNKYFIVNCILFRIKRKNEKYITTIDNQTKFLEKKYYLKDNYFSQIYNGVDTKKFYIVPQEFHKNNFLKKIGVDPRHRIILMVAGYRDEKRHIDAIKAFEDLQNEINNVTLICVGNDNYRKRNELQCEINLKKIKNILLFTSSEVQLLANSVLKFYWISDIFTLTSNKVETFSIASLEAMACGIPCVLTNIGGAKNYIKPNINGRLCKPNNIKSIKNEWLSVLNNPDKYDKYVIRKIIIENYSIEKSAFKYLKLMKENIL